MIIESFYYQRIHGSLQAYSSQGYVDASELPYVSAKINDRNFAAFSFGGHLRRGGRLALYYETNEI